MGKRVSSKCFRDPTAEEVFFNEGIKDDPSEKDEAGNCDIVKIASKEKRVNGIPYYPFYSTGRGTKT